MRKFYFMLVSLVLMATTADAQVTAADLFGKWKFEATLQFADNVSEEQKALFSGDCEVVISEHNIYDAKITGFAGSQNSLPIHSVVQSSTSGKYAAYINNPNPTPALFSGMYLADAEGHNPTNHFVADGTVDDNNEPNGEWVSYGPLYYILNDDNSEMTIPDFTVVTVADYYAHEANVIVKFTNAKMTFVEPVTVEVVDISGDWDFKAGDDNEKTVDTMEGSAIPTEFALSLVKSSDDNRAYNATIAIDGYAAVEMPATFDGNVLSLSFNEKCIDETNGIYFSNFYNISKEGTITFKYVDETAFTLSSGVSFATFGTEEKDGETVVTSESKQYYINGSLKKPSATSAFAWDGVWTLKVASAADVIVATGGQGMEWPAEFQMEVSCDEATNTYSVNKFLGYDVSFNDGGFALTPTETGATIALDGYNGCALLKDNGDGTWLQLKNSSNQATTLTLTVNEDGTVAVDPVFIVNLNFNTTEETSMVFYQNLTAEKAAAVEPEAPTFSWAGTHTINMAEVESYDGNEYAKSFEVEVIYDEVYNEYLVIKVFGNDVSALNYGGILLNVAEDGKSATINAGANVGGKYPSYLKLNDAEGMGNPIKITIAEDGTIIMDSFLVQLNDGANVTKVVLYKNDAELGINGVDAENAEQVIYDITGRRVDVITEAGIYIINGKKVLVK